MIPPPVEVKEHFLLAWWSAGKALSQTACAMRTKVKSSRYAQML